MWHLPGGTVRFGEPLVEAVARVARDELALTVEVGDLLGYIEYPSHYENGLDCPVGLAFAARIAEPGAADPPRANCEWFQATSGQHARRAEGLPRREAWARTSDRRVTLAEIARGQQVLVLAQLLGAVARHELAM